MKWNWGTGIFLVIVVFFGLCAAFLIYSQRQVWNMVEEDYYPKELRYEEQLVKMRNANALSEPLQVSTGGGVLMVRFPVDLHGLALTGTIHIYRPSDETLDLTLPVAVDSALVQTIPLEKLKRGRYVVKAEWSASGKTYYKEQDIFIP